MPATPQETWLNESRKTVRGYREMIDSVVSQLSDEELNARPAPGFNSVAIVLRHLGGNLKSRWTGFLTSDGEKEDRNRDQEFQDWPGDRESLMNFFDEGWSALESVLAGLNEEDCSQSVLIRGEEHSVPQAILRSLTHVSYHVGQIMLVARLLHDGQWQWLTVEPGKSNEFNQRTWGTAASRSVLGRRPDR